MIPYGRQSIDKDDIKAVVNVLRSDWLTQGPSVKSFEQALADYCGAKYAVTTSNGTTGLHLAYLAAGLKKGDEVITVANTFFATIEPLLSMGAKPVFVDVDPGTYLMDVSKIEAKVTKKTKAIVPVHLFGQMVDMNGIMKIARRFKLKVIEDCAQAHGATQRWRKAGTFGNLGIYSFFPSKNLGAYGDAGALVTNNETYAMTAKKLRDHGRSGKYAHDTTGVNSRLDGIQAAVLTVKLKHLDFWVRARRGVAKQYDKLLSSAVKTPRVLAGNMHSYYVYVVEAERRDELLEYLRSKGVEAGIHYPIPLHHQKAWRNFGYPIPHLPVTEAAAEKILSLPIFPEMTNKEVREVSEIIKNFYRRKV